MQRFVLLFLITVALSASATAQVSFKVPIFVRCGTIGDTLFIGVNPGNTIGIDSDESFKEFQEGMMPPLPPPPFPFDARMISLPGRVSAFPTGLGTGTNRDFRGYLDPAQLDSFRIRFSGELLETTPVLISWPQNLSDYAGAWTIKPQSGSDWPTLDMLSDTSVTIPPLGQPTVIIIKQGARLVSVGHTDAPAAIALAQNYPNPFGSGSRTGSAMTTISYSLAERMPVRLAVHNILGEEVALLTNAESDPGTHFVRFDAAGLSGGAYLAVLQAGTTTITRTMIVVR
ncbi:MAG: T9SS type A sorting domain-containing protein [Bacteroidetes bacterium]|nr:T9SS type A sorting domain-containing protein [Bacteroidota bacterium]